MEYNRGMDSIDGDKKNEELAMEYTCLLTSQLEDQRKYFEVNLIFFFQFPEKLEPIEKKNYRFFLLFF